MNQALMSSTRPLLYRAALMAAMAIILGSAPVAFAAPGVDHDKQETVVPPAPTPDEVLKLFTKNITEAAKNGQIKPYVGGREELRKMIEKLNAEGTKALYVLGGAGDGKTAFVEYAGSQLPDHTIYSLNLNNFEAGTGYRGTLEDRFKSLVEAFVGHPERILFIDEMHVAMKMTGFMDNLKPAMARGEINFIGATTDAEYREFIEKDAALTSRGGNPIYMKAPTASELLSMARANQERLEKGHGIRILDSANVEAVRLTMRYYGNEPLRRKVLEILDLAAARMVLNAKLGNYDKLGLEDRLEELNIEEKSIRSDMAILKQGGQFKSTTIEHAARLNEIRLDKAATQDRIDQIDFETQTANKQLEVQKLYDAVKAAQQKGDLALAAEIKYKQIPALEADIKAAGMLIVDGRLANVLTDIQINRFVSAELRIPAKLTKMTDAERMDYQDTLMKSKVLGQEQAIYAISQKAKIRLSGVEPVTGPQGVIMADGPSGVGKSEMTKALAEAQFGDPRRIISINMNAYGPHSQMQLFGAGVGLKDGEKGGAFDQVRRDRFTVISIDEFDKTPRDLFPSFLQMFDTGVVTDNQGRFLDFRNTMIVLQGNFTGEYSLMKDHWTQAQTEQRFGMAPGSLNGLSGIEKDAAVLDAAMDLKGVPVELRGRITTKIVFNPMSPDMAYGVADKMLREQVEFLQTEKGIRLVIDNSVVTALVKAAYDPIFGARPLRDKRSEIISGLLADLNLLRGMTVKLTFEDGEDGRGGKLKATIDNRDALARDVLFRQAFNPKAKAAEAIGEAGKASDPTDPKEIITKTVRSPRTKK